jgi:hypothetical protein
VTVSRHWSRWLAQRQLEDLWRTQRVAQGDDREAARARMTLRAYRIGYGSPLEVVRRGRFRYEVVSELPKLH